jgi:hypothetical protein
MRITEASHARCADGGRLNTCYNRTHRASSFHYSREGGIRRSAVIPAKAGIQQKNALRVADKNMLSGCAGFFNWLDSSFRWNDGGEGNDGVGEMLTLARSWTNWQL